MTVRIRYDYCSEILRIATVTCLDRTDPKMILRNFCNNLFWPYFLINKLISMINFNNKVNSTAKCHRSSFRDIQIKIKRVFIIRVDTERQSPMFNSCNRSIISVYLRYTEFEVICRICQCYF